MLKSIDSAFTMSHHSSPLQQLWSENRKESNYSNNFPESSINKQTHMHTIKNIEELHDARLYMKKSSDQDDDEETLVTANSSTASTQQTHDTLDSNVHEESTTSIPSSVQKNEWIPVQRTKRKNPITADAPPDKPPAIKDLIQQRGEAQIDSTTNLLTPVKIEFSMNGKKNLNVRNDFITVFNAMKKVDIT